MPTLPLPRWVRVLSSVSRSDPAHVDVALSIGKPSETSNDLANMSCVAVDGRAVLFRGRSGSGKSTLCLEIMALGGDLVCDDGVVLTKRDEQVIVACPQALKGRIEARGVGIIAAQAAGAARLALVVDLDKTATKRLPERQFCHVMGISLPLIHKVEGPHFAAVIVQLLKGGLAG